MPQTPVHDAPGSSTTSPSPELNASAGQLIGSIATPVTPGRQLLDGEYLQVAERVVEPDSARRPSVRTDLGRRRPSGR